MINIVNKYLFIKTILFQAKLQYLCFVYLLFIIILNYVIAILNNQQ